MIEFAGVVVPARDEEESIAACLASVRRATDHAALGGIPVEVVVVLDRCQDGTGDLVAAGTEVVEVDAGNVGQARSAGMHRLLSRAEGLDPDRVWLATTDADSRVPPDWLAAQLAWAGRGAEAVAGTVRVDDWSQQPPAARQRFLAHQRAGGLTLGHDHVHGANLGLTAAAYLATGGVPELPLAEDHALWEALAMAGRRLVKADDITVVTSARREARADGGFSSLLRRLSDDVAAQ